MGNSSVVSQMVQWSCPVPGPDREICGWNSDFQVDVTVNNIIASTGPLADLVPMFHEFIMHDSFSSIFPLVEYTHKILLELASPYLPHAFNYRPPKN